ncbi:hypothetical protein MJO10_33700, partial [Salmonella enterica subsp. enterica serovar Anatum]|nr:hypothetical protein [Salmonella enterica subsp. enterica serovar Anatum]
LLRYWQADLAREALFWHIQQELTKNNAKDIGLGFDCRVLFLRGQEIPCFALTSPEAGSDAGAIPDTGVVCMGEWQGQQVLGMR